MAEFHVLMEHGTSAQPLLFTTLFLAGRAYLLPRRSSRPPRLFFSMAHLSLTSE